MKKALAIAMLAVAAYAADPAKVMVTPAGKTYHPQKCMALARSKTVYTVTLDAAKAHGLKPCGICYRPKTEKKAEKNDWAKK